LLVAAIVIVVVGAAGTARAQSEAAPGCAEPRPARGTFYPLTFPGATDIIPSAINDKGTIVGGLIDADSQRVHSFLYRHGRMRLIDVPGSATTGASDINDRGTIAGWFGFPTHGFVRHRGVLTTIDAPGLLRDGRQRHQQSKCHWRAGSRTERLRRLNVGFVRYPTVRSSA
jgi:probable HAF family extracellular repeat protein